MSRFQVGFPIRKSPDQRVLSPPRGLSQSAASFIASSRQGIHPTPFSRLIASRKTTGGARAPRPLRSASLVPGDALSGAAVSVLDLERRDDHAASGPEGPAPASVSRLSLHDVKEPSIPHGDPKVQTNMPSMEGIEVRWWRLPGSNRRPPACKAGALPAELSPRASPTRRAVVGRGGLEPPTSRLSGVRSNHLSYRPVRAPRAAGPQRSAPRARLDLRKGREDGPAAGRDRSLKTGLCPGSAVEAPKRPPGLP